MSFKSYKEESKGNYGTWQEKPLNLEQLNTGAILRIADATEKMASNYVKMEKDLAWYKERSANKEIEIEKLRRSNAALRGVIKRMKKET